MRHVTINKEWNNKQPATNVIIGKTLDTRIKYITKDGLFFINNKICQK